MRLRRLLSTAAAALLLVAACSSGDDGATSPDPASDGGESADETTTTVAAEALATAALGPYSVGRRTVTITDPARDGREIVTDIWYPTGTDEGDPSTYTFIPGIAYDSEVALDAPPVSDDGPFPMVIYSHGSGGLRYVASFFTETLASHGVVVVAPEHAGNTTLDQFADSSDPADVVAANRPEDVAVTISALLDGSVDAEVTAAVDAGTIGVTGHSLGGYTALASAGGVGELSVESDDRVGAIVAFAPASGRLSDADLAAIDIPTMVISGTLDEVTPIEPNTRRISDNVVGRPLLRVDLEGATHQSFSDACAYTEILREIPDISSAILELVDEQAGDTCDPDVLDVDRAQDLTNQYAIAFLLAELAGSVEAQAVLDSDEVADVVDYTVTN